MPVNAVPISSRLQLRLNLGLDDQGRPIIRTRSYRNILTTASDEDLYNTGQELAELQDHELEVISRMNELELEQE